MMATTYSFLNLRLQTILQIEILMYLTLIVEFFFLFQLTDRKKLLLCLISIISVNSKYTSSETVSTQIAVETLQET